ncbi:MAG TPA: protein kinase [Blastocatellia bacterium]|nr:protein kinase [Blastocatellia bacterium]
MTPERYEKIGQLYHAALELAPADRAAFLAEACGDDELRRDVASLIASHEQADNFIEQPPDDVAAGWQAAAASPPGRSFAHYQMFSLLGRGGMGEVWLAEDTKLGRKVAVKLLAGDVTTDVACVRRFAQEARAASSLNHPNIITIYEIGEAVSENGGTHYIATEYVEGETLRQRIASAPHQQIRLAEALDVATQIAAALAAAHEAGIVHRDIKPENVMMRRDRIVKVLDFGLAKLTEPATPAVDTQLPTLTGTEPGMLMGTPRYMSPEQARGEKVDARTDIFSLGILLYEMVTGRAPFAGTTMSEAIAAILRDEPPPLAESLADAPPELERIISKALRKDRAARYQTTQDLLTDLKEFKQLIESGTRPVRPRRVMRKAPVIVAAAGLALAAIVGWFYLNRHPALTEKDTILLADFENKTGDEIFDGALKQALAIQLQSSPFLNLFPEPRVRQTMGLMGRAPNERVTAEIAGEICVRNNLKALIAGAIAPLGSHYVITLEAINGHSGESLGRQQVEAESREQVLRALSQAASQLREKLGESLSSIQRSNSPLYVEQATTSKLEAFKAWSLAVENSYSGRVIEAIPLYKRAIALDPEFAHAYSVLSTLYGNTGRPGLAAEYAEKGYKLRDRVSEYEKLRITNFYYAFATGELSNRIEVLKLLNTTYPRDGAGPADLALTYRQIGQFDQAVEEAHEAIRRNPNFAPSHRALVLALFHLNHFSEAKDTIALAVQQKINHTDFHYVLYQIAFIDGDLGAMQEQIDWLSGKPDEYVASDWQSGSAAFAGQWRKAQESASRAIDLAAHGDTKEIAARYATEQSMRGAIFGDYRRAKEDAAQGLKLARGRASLPRAALALALCGEAGQAKSLIDELVKLYPEDTVIHSIWAPAIRAAIELQRGNAAQAIELLQPASRYEAAAEFWPQYLRGVSYLKLKRGMEAAAEFQKILDNRGQAALSSLYPLANLGLARAWDLVGDASRSRKAQGDFFAAWKDADSDLPIMIEARREYEKR